MWLCAIGWAALPLAGYAQEEAQTDASAAPIVASPTVYDPVVVARYPHDQEAFTQGLLWHDGVLFESTGREGQSQIRKLDLDTGRVLQSQPIPSDQFGEGLALWEGDLVSLTWRDRAIHRWKLEDLSPVRTHADYPFEGWGLTVLGSDLVASDGSATLRFLDPETYAVRRELEVTYNGEPLMALNELEVIDGLIYANVWLTGFIVAIEPETGVVERVVDLRPLVRTVPVPDGSAVLNGIAWDAKDRRLFVTGKLWPSLFEIELRERVLGD